MSDLTIPESPVAKPEVMTLDRWSIERKSLSDRFEQLVTFEISNRVSRSVDDIGKIAKTRTDRMRIKAGVLVATIVCVTICITVNIIVSGANDNTKIRHQKVESVAK